VDNHPLTIDDIMEHLCQHFGVTQQQVVSKSRKREFVQVHQMAMYLAQKHTKMPASRIGLLIGQRDHSTVIHSCAAIEKRLKVDKSFAEEMNSIENSFKLKK
jgi:chromosomal replication initiator protein